MYYFKARENDQVASGLIDLENFSIQNAFKKTGKKFSFEIDTKDRVYFLYADNQSEMEEWMNILSNTSKNYKIQQSDRSSFVEGGALVLSIKGMMCERCEVRVKNIIQKIPGVTSSEINVNDELATIEGKFNVNQVCVALEESGFLPVVQ